MQPCRKDTARVPADLAGDEDLTALRSNTVGEASRGRPVPGMQKLHLKADSSSRRRSRQDCDFSLKRWILPVCVLGSALTNLTERGYL